MSGGRISEVVSIATQALEVHCQPARHAELLRGFAPLPPGVSALLRLAGGTALDELDPWLASLAPEGELRRAALFFIEHVLFQRDASHYRVLGLNRDASHEQIKEHHRLLMRLFHPDRESHLSEQREQYATRANLAYNILRDADSRADYDGTLKAQAAPSRPSAAAARTAQPVRRSVPRTWRQRPEPDSFWTVRVYPLLMRYLPQWVLAGTALVSVTLVGAVYLFNPRVELSPLPAEAGVAADPEHSAALGKATEPAVQIAAADVSGLDAVADQLEGRDTAAGQVLASPQPVVPESAKPAPRPAPAKVVMVDAPRTKPAPPVGSIAAQPAPVKSAPVKPISAMTEPRPEIVAVAVPAAVAHAAAQDTTRSASPPAAMSEAATQPVAAAMRVSAPAAEPALQPTLPDPNTLMSRFLEAYERGDVQTCMSLLDDGLRSNAGGKPELRREYDSLFRGTDLRHVKILTMSWSRDGEFIRGVGRYRSTLMRKGETLLQTQDGQVRVEMVRRGNSAVINELYYIAGGRS
jgi:hypothetical protein